MSVLEGLGLPPDQGDVPTDTEETIEQPQAAAPIIPEPEAEEPVTIPEGAENPDAVKAAIQSERKLAREANARAREYKRQLEEIADAGKPLEERLANAERRAQEADLHAMRVEIGVSKGLSVELAKRLQGDDAASIQADAQTLSEAIAARPKQQLPSLDGGVKDNPPPVGDPAAAHNHLLADALRGLRR